MIDIRNETLVPLRDVPRRLPPRPNGRRLHISAVYRWIQYGVRGVRLEAIRIGGTMHTSEEALQRWIEQTTQQQGASIVESAAPSAMRQRQIERAAREVEAILRPGAQRNSPTDWVRSRGDAACAD